MKITMLFGSPHLNGTTNVLAENFIKGAQEAGHEVTRIDLARKKIAPCMACDYCRRTGDACVQKDDMTEVAAAVMQSELVVLVTPLYYFGMSAQLKLAIDRFYAINGKLRETPCKAILLAACADEIGAMDALKAHYDALCGYLHWTDAGVLLVANCCTKEDIDQTDCPQRAYQLGRTIK